MMHILFLITEISIWIAKSKSREIKYIIKSMLYTNFYKKNMLIDIYAGMLFEDR